LNAAKARRPVQPIGVASEARLMIQPVGQFL
jgi:hypothetical protein